MVSFTIDFDGSIVVYSPGQKVNGKARLSVPDGFKARKVRIEMIGKAYTYWEGDVKNNTKIKNSDIVRVRHNCADHKGKIVYAREENVVWKCDDSRNEFPEGDYEFNFGFQLPYWCPPSFEGDLGFIRYFVKMEIDRPWKFDDKFIRCFTVLPKIDLSHVPNASQPLRKHICEETGSILWKKGLVKMEVKLLKQGYVCGEKLEFVMKVENNTAKIFNKVYLKLVQCITYTGFRDGFVDTSAIAHNEKNMCQKVMYSTRLNAQHRVEERKFSEEVVDVKVGEHSTSTLEHFITLPSLCPSIKTCDIISVEYFLKMKLSSGGTFGTSIKMELPFIIGTEPAGKDDGMKFDYKKTVFGFSATRLKNRNLQKFAPSYPVYKF